MATWTKHNAGASIFGDASQGYIATNGTLIYTIDDNDPVEIWSYDPGTDTATTIGDLVTDWPTGDGFTFLGPIAYFKSTLYVLVQSDGVSENETQVFSYDGTAHNWTQVFSRGVASSGLQYTDNEMVLITRETDGVWISTDGSSWPQGTIRSGADTPDANATGCYGDTTLTFACFLDTDNGQFYVKLSGSNLTDIGNNVDGGFLVNSDYYYVKVSSVDKYTDDLMNFYDPDPGFNFEKTYNMSRSAGSDLSGPTNVYFFNNPPAWEDQGGPLPANPKGFIRTDDNTVYAVCQSDLYVSDTPLPPLASNAKFYHGAGTLAEKFTLPFAGVNPAAFTLDKALGTIVVGSNAPTAQPIISSPSPYVTGTASGTNFPTGTSITGLDWI